MAHIVFQQNRHIIFEPIGQFDKMRLLSNAVRGLSSPTILIVVVWSVVLLCVAFGPIDYGAQPSTSVLAVVAVGISLFVAASRGGAWFFDSWSRTVPNAVSSDRILSIAVAATSVLGLVGIGLMGLDRLVLSGAGNGGYAELLRCAPDLVSVIEVKRTPLLYLGYLTFSFGYASLVLFILRGEQVTGWTAILGQLSIVSPVGYAMLYSGRMPILFVILLIVAAALVRVGQGMSPMPRSHHLAIKLAAVFVLFGIYSSAMWATRQSFCVEMTGVIRELQLKVQQRDEERLEAFRRARTVERPGGLKAVPTTETHMAPALPMSPASPLSASSVSPLRADAADPVTTTPPADPITVADVTRMIDDAKMSAPSEPAERRTSAQGVNTILVTMAEAWRVKPRGYVTSAIDSGHLPAGAVAPLLSTYFYLTHGVRVLDTAWSARDQIDPQWGTYEIGVLSPLLRVFFPHNSQLDNNMLQLKSVGIYGFFPTAWAAAFIDFGLVGAIIYVLLFGFAAGWSSTGARKTGLLLPAVLQTFVLASILTSPVQGPLGVANSALILAALLVTGLAVDFAALGAASRRARDAEARASA